MSDMMGLTPDQKLVKEYVAKFKACESARQRFERQWYSNLAFFFGRQNVEWTRSISSSSGYVLQNRQVPAYRVRHISNKIRPIIRKEITKLNKENPQFYVVPASPDDEDMMAARLAEAVAEHLLYTTNFNAKRRQAVWWATTTGTGLIKTTYNEAGVDRYGYQGTIDFDVISPFHFWVPNIDCPELELQPYVFHAVGLSSDEVLSKYGVELEPENSGKSHDNRYLSGLGVNSKQQDIAQVFVREVWIKPSAKFPDGAMFVMGNDDTLLYMQEGLEELPDNDVGSNVVAGRNPISSFPYEHKLYPFTKIDHIPSGKFYSDSVITDLIPLQKDYNRSRSQTLEARNLTSKPQWAVARGSVDVTKITAKPGLIIEYTPGFDAPQPVKNPDIPSYVERSEERTLRDMDQNSNQYEVTQGRTPPGVEAASAIAYLQEESDSILNHTVDSLEEAVADIGFKALSLVREKWDGERTIQAVSGMYSFETFVFHNDNMPQSIDFRVESGSMQPRSRAAKQAFIMEMIKEGIIPQMEGLKYLEMSATNRLYADLQVDNRHAERENFKMKNGMVEEAEPQMDPETGEEIPAQPQFSINEFDNHTVHILTHERFMKSQEFEGLDPQIQEVMLDHYRQHLFAYGQQIQDSQMTEEENGSRTESGRDESGA